MQLIETLIALMLCMPAGLAAVPPQGSGFSAPKEDWCEGHPDTDKPDENLAKWSWAVYVRGVATWNPNDFMDARSTNITSLHQCAEECISTWDQFPPSSEPCKSVFWNPDQGEHGSCMLYRAPPSSNVKIDRDGSWVDRNLWEAGGTATLDTTCDRKQESSVPCCTFWTADYDYYKSIRTTPVAQQEIWPAGPQYINAT